MTRVTNLVHSPHPHDAEVQTGNSDWATNRPEYKVTAIEVVFIAQKGAWARRAQEERSMPKQQRKRNTVPA